MDPTGLPTDNLYKFMATSGLATAGFCLWFWWTRMRQFWTAQYQMRKDMAAVRAKADALRQTNGEVKEKLLEGQAESASAVKKLQELGTLPPSAKVSSDVAAIEKLIPVLGAQMEANLAAVAALQAPIAEVDKEMSVIQAEAAKQLTERRLLEKLKYAMIIFGAFGLAWSSVGFVLWYRNVQWYADRQSKAEFEDKMAELGLKKRARDNACWKEQHQKPPVPASSACP